MQLAVDEERELSLSLKSEVELLSEKLQELQETSEKRITEFTRENEVLRNQLKKYVAAVQLLKRDNKNVSKETNDGIISFSCFVIFSYTFYCLNYICRFIELEYDPSIYIFFTYCIFSLCFVFSSNQHLKRLQRCVRSCFTAATQRENGQVFLLILADCFGPILCFKQPKILKFFVIFQMRLIVRP